MSLTQVSKSVPLSSGGMPAGGETLNGVLERVLFFNEDNHYCVGEFRLDADEAVITLSGVLPGVQCGETLEVKGDWTNHPQYGRQFKVQSFTAQLPASVYGIRKYLASGLVHGVGKVYAQKIVDAFGVDTFRVISDESGRLRDIPGIGPQRARAIKKAWDDQRSVREVMTFLQTYGIGNAQCLKLVKAYGDNARQMLETEPYRVAREIPGIGFKTADKMALNVGFSSEHPPRIDAGILFALEDLESEGHTGAWTILLEARAMELLEVPLELIRDRFKALVEAKDLLPLEGGEFLQRPLPERAESIIASCLARLSKAPSSLPSILVDKALEWAATRASITYAPEQSEALKTALTSKVSIVTGGPGTGKTTLLKSLVEVLRAKSVNIILASPTGRAAQRMAETTGAFAQTLHRLLKFDVNLGRFSHDEKNPIRADYLIVDETSMLDSRLAASLLRALPDGCHCLFVGDVHQLPSVGSGNVLKDWIECGLIPVTRLQHVFRQGSRSSIVTVAHSILQGEKQCPIPATTVDRVRPEEDFHFLRSPEPEHCLDLIRSLATTHLPEWYGPELGRDVQVLAPLHRGTVGTLALNKTLQEALKQSSHSFHSAGQVFRVGDKVIQTRNNYDLGIFNGDMGRIVDYNGESGLIAVDFDGLMVEFDRTDATDLQLAYTISVHKSQGSEFAVVILPILKQQFIMLQRNLLYTAITRGRKKVFLVGDPAAYAMAVANAESTARQTGLKAKMIAAF